MVLGGDKGEEAARRQVARILQSETFRNADSLRRLLAYLAEKSLSGEADQLKEYTVGVEAFGKPESYDPQHDASVRIQAGKLRQKIEEYYRSEGRDDPVLLMFPKGRFRFQFAPAPPAGHPAPQRFWKIACAVLAALLLAALVWAVAPRRSSPSQLTREQREIWGPLLEDNRPLILSLGSPLFVKTPGGFFRSPRVNRWEEISGAREFGWLRREYADDEMVPVHIYTGLGDALGAVQITKLLSAAGRDLIAKRSTAVTWEELTTHNVVFLGPPKYTLQLKEIPVHMDLVMEGNTIRNLAPRKGEPATLMGNWPDKTPYVAEDYALISRIPGLHGRREYLILSASSTEGTAAAASFVTDPNFVRELANRLRAPSGRVPRYFQAVIHARFRAMVPVEMHYRFHHELSVPPPGSVTKSGPASPKQ